MNPLVDDFPRELCGIPIDTDYRRMVQFELLLREASVPEADKIQLALSLLYKQPVPDPVRAWDRLLWYYSCGQNGEQVQDEGKAAPPRLYDFETDAQRIYTAFLQCYRIDLQKEPLHWWKFHALLLYLPDTCVMGKAMYYRGLDVSTLKGAERKHAMRMKALFTLDKPKATTQAERDREFLARIEKRRHYLEAQLAKQKRGEA